MGTSSSTLNELQDNKYLQSFTGREPISHNDPFWNQLLSFTFTPPHTSIECRLLQESIHPMLEALLINNSHTGNLGALINVFLLRASELKASVQCENKVFIWQTYNALFILRCVIKFFIETLGDDSIIKHFQEKIPEKLPCDEDDRDAGVILELFINSLVEIIVDVPLIDVTYAITVESVNTLLVLLAVQMFSSRPAPGSFIYKAMMQGKCSIHALLLMKTLLQHYIKQEKCPHCLTTSVEGNGIISGLASGLWSVLTLGYGRSIKSSENSYQPVLANHCLLLLLALVNHCTNKKEVANPYRQALFTFRNSEKSADEKSADTLPAFKLNYKKLYSVLCTTLRNDQSTILLYLLLHCNHDFRLFAMSNENIDELVVPILKILYSAPERNSHHIYMALIALLILSEDSSFNDKVQNITLKSITWYTERSLSEISLGGLMVLVIIRTIQYNMTRMHDKYLHTNCLAALANMSGTFRNLHPYVCQRFISLFEYLGRRQSRMVMQLRNSKDCGHSDGDDDMDTSDLVQDISILEEVVRMLLEILNSCLTAQLQHNTNLLYTLLYKRHIFDAFRTHSTFQDIIQNIDMVLIYFTEHLEAADKNLSVGEVSKIITAAAMKWPKDKLKKFPELKFKYVEEGQPEEFFIPYLWSLVFHVSSIYWNPKNILIFNPHKEF